mgnify:CR=1 FL=1
MKNINGVVCPHTQFFLKDWKRQVEQCQKIWINDGRALRFTSVAFKHIRGDNSCIEIANFGHN